MGNLPEYKFFHVGISPSNDNQGLPMPLTDIHSRSLKPGI